MSHLLGISGGGVSTETITADASETMLKVVDGDDCLWKRKRCAIEIDILEKHQGIDALPVLRIEDVAPGTKVGSYTLVEKLAFDVCAPDKKPDTTVQASKFTLYDPHPLLHPSRKGTRLNDPETFHAPPQESRSEIERTPLLPKLGCSQVSFVAKKQKDIFDNYAIKEKLSAPYMKIPITRSQVSFADRHRSSREEIDPYHMPVRTPSLPSQPSHLEQVVMMSSLPSQHSNFLRTRKSDTAELIPLVPTDDSGWKNIDTHIITGRAATNREDAIIGRASERPVSAPATAVFSSTTHPLQARHYTGDLCALTDPCPTVAQQAAIITPSQHRSQSENVQSSSLLKHYSPMEVVSVNIRETLKSTKPLQFPTDESIVGIIPGVLLPEQTAYGKRPKISIEELQKPLTKPGFEDSSSEEEQVEEDEAGALPKKGSILEAEAERIYIKDSEISPTPITVKKHKFEFIWRFFTCNAFRSKKKQEQQQQQQQKELDVGSSNVSSGKEPTEISSPTDRPERMSGRSSHVSAPSERSRPTQNDQQEFPDTPAKTE